MEEAASQQTLPVWPPHGSSASTPAPGGRRPLLRPKRLLLPQSFLSNLGPREIKSSNHPDSEWLRPGTQASPGLHLHYGCAGTPSRLLCVQQGRVVSASASWGGQKAEGDSALALS